MSATTVETPLDFLDGIDTEDDEILHITYSDHSHVALCGVSLLDEPTIPELEVTRGSVCQRCCELDGWEPK